VWLTCHWIEPNYQITPNIYTYLSI
jgi:hypothetical protein